MLALRTDRQPASAAGCGTQAGRKVTEPARVDQVITSTASRPARTDGSASARRRASSAGLSRSPARDILLRKWSVPVLAGLQQPRRFSELRASLPAVTPWRWRWRCRTWESAALIRRDVLPTRPPSALYQPTRSARLVLLGGGR